MAADRPTGPTAWIAVSPDTDPLVETHIEHTAGEVLGETHRGDDWREALAWARDRAGLDDGRTAPRRAVRQVRLGAGELHRIAAFWAAVTGGTVAPECWGAWRSRAAPAG
jgi:hypothetical protein